MNDEGSLRERLIDAGVDLVTAEGTASLGLREIARRAGVSHGAPRRHFPTHHSLLAAIARRGFADLGARFTAATGAPAPARDRLQALARVYVGYALEQRGMFELMYRHDLLDSGPHPSAGPRLRDSTVPLFERIVALVAECTAARHDGQAAGAPAVTAAALWANLHGVAQLWTWGSLQLVLGAPESAGDPGHGPTTGPLDTLVTAVLDAHLGPVAP
ncbi:TetR/AcrR family transcriptional regulator [Kitasatospora paranensis]|uniref:TetR/AcrR family transcriptional regulator n=1 Tax=Kitasatospora paranensis TaxID=258053 RepID=A0ABW2G287_9ACTN